MIRYALKCPNGHGFESWFESADAFDTLSARDLITCPICGAVEIAKAIMAPRINTPTTAPDEPAQPAQTTPAAPQAQSEATLEQALTRMRADVEANSEYVGGDFAREARDMHDGLTPERAIHGEARLDEARKLFEDGVPVAPLPFTPTKKLN